MPQPTLKASDAGIEKAKIALIDKGWTPEDLAERVLIRGESIHIHTVKKFFANKKGVRPQYFVAICKALGLDWQEIREPNGTPSPQIPLPNDNPTAEVEQPNINHNNPFIPQHGKIDDPRFFFGREREIRRVFETLNSGSSVAIIGESEIGKSSLLQAIYREAPNQLHHPRKPIYLDLQIVCHENDFYDALCHKAGIETVKGYSLERALESHRLLLLLDEVENMKWDGFTNPTRSLLRGLTEGYNPPLRLVIAARTSLDILFPGKNMTSPFKGHEENLKQWDEKICREFIASRLQASWLTPVAQPVNFTEAEIAGLIAESGGYPQKLMQLCYQTYAGYIN
ncbi:XRE family transcriptional regulator [Microcoleus sp. S13C4]|uniref:XRE family transcriptional regulator n=1 Tax=Microcoleus sp. S13C4 TaxID=3055410 RepID=UPI002FD48490